MFSTLKAIKQWAMGCWLLLFMLTILLAPGTLTQDVVEVQGDGLLVNEALHLSFQISRQDSHESLGGEPVLGSLLVVSLGHVGEHGVGGLVDVVDDLAEVGLEVSGGQILQVGEGGSGDVSLPLEPALSLINHTSESGVLLHELNEGLGDLQLVSGDGGLATGQSVLIGPSVLSQISGLAHVGGEDNEIEVLVDVVHDLGLEEHLGGVVHDLVAQLGLSNVLSELLDTSTSSLGGTIFVNDLVAFSLGTLTVSTKISNQCLDDLELSSEESILVGVHLVSVHLEERQVHAGHSLDESLEGGGDLELLVEAGGDAASGGPGEADLVVDDDGGVDGGSHKGADHDVEVSLQGSSGVAHGNSPVNQAGVFLLQSLDSGAESLDALHLDLLGVLVDVNILQLTTIGLGALLAGLDEADLLLLDAVTGDVAELGVLSDLVRRAGTQRLSVDVDGWLLPQVEPDDLAVLGVGGSDLLQGFLKAFSSGLATAVDLVAWDSPEVGTPGDGVGQLLDLLKMIPHDCWILCHLDCRCSCLLILTESS